MLLRASLKAGRALAARPCGLLPPLSPGALAAGLPRIGRSFAAQAGGDDSSKEAASGSGAGSSASSSEKQGWKTGEKENPALGEGAGEMKKGSDNVQFTWRSAVFTSVMCAGCLAYYEVLRRRKETDARAITKHERLGTPKLGGPFELVDRKGKPVTEQDFLGQYLLIYFGFTFCPDICPQEMEKQTRVIELLDAEFGAVATPVFISVDPARDQPPQVDEYCQEFHPRIAGLTGTPEQVKKASRAYRVYFNEGIRNSDQDYLIDHSIIHYFVGKNGKFVDFFGKNMTAQEMADKMKTTIAEDRAKQKARKERRGVESADEEE